VFTSSSGKPLGEAVDPGDPLLDRLVPGVDRDAPGEDLAREERGRLVGGTSSEPDFDSRTRSRKRLSRRATTRFEAGS
jgi:hypothetical protein